MTDMVERQETGSPVNKRTRRDPAATRSRILNAATKLFAEKGPDAASIDDISSASGYNRRMIYHYFENKRGLYLAVLENVYSRITTLVVEEAVAATTLPDLIDSLFDRYFAFLQTNPEFVAMLQWENAHGANGLAGLQLGDFRERLLGQIQDVLQKHSGGTLVEPDDAAFHLVLMCLSVCGYYFSNRDSISVVFQRDLRDSREMDGWLQHAKGVVLRGLVN